MRIRLPLPFFEPYWKQTVEALDQEASIEGRHYFIVVVEGLGAAQTYRAEDNHSAARLYATHASRVRQDSLYGVGIFCFPITDSPGGLVLAVETSKNTAERKLFFDVLWARHRWYHKQNTPR